MDAETYIDLKTRIVQAGHQHELDWIAGIQPIDNALDFWGEYAWVVLNSGMKNTIARQIWDRVRPHVLAGGSAHDVFGHNGKAEAIDTVYFGRDAYFDGYRQMETDEKRMEYIEGLPWIGPITKYHLAKNYGMNVAKPDRHLVRIAAKYGLSVDQLCERLRDLTGDKVSMVDMVLWRAASLGFV